LTHLREILQEGSIRELDEEYGNSEKVIYFPSFLPSSLSFLFLTFQFLFKVVEKLSRLFVQGNESVATIAAAVNSFANEFSWTINPEEFFNQIISAYTSQLLRFDLASDRESLSFSLKKTKQNKTKQNKTKQNKTKQNKKKWSKI